MKSHLKRTFVSSTSCFFLLFIIPPVSSELVRLDGADAKLEPTLQALTVLHDVDLISHLWQQYVNMALLPLASSSVTVRREMVVFNNQTVSRIEGSANHLMQRLTDGELKCSIYIFS